MLKKTLYPIILLIFVFSLYSCKEPFLSADKKLCIGFCVDSLGLGDQVFNGKVIEALNELNRDSEFKFLIKECGTKENYTDNIRATIQNCNILFCSYLMNDEVLKLSSEFREKFFILLDGIASNQKNDPVIQDNVVSCIFSESDKAFIAGAKSQEFLKAGEKAGIICVGDKLSPNVRLNIDSFKSGIKRDEKKLEIIYKFLRNAEDSTQGLKLYSELTKEGCKLIYLCNGSYIKSILDSPERDKVFLIVDGIYEDLIKSNVLGLVERDYKVVLKKIIEDFKANKLKGGVQIFGMDSGALNFSPSCLD